MVVWVSVWVVSFGLWLVLVGSFDFAESLGGLIGATLAATGFTLVQRRDATTTAIRLGWLGLLVWRVPPQAIGDCVRVLGVLVRLGRGDVVEGRIRRAPFDPGSPDKPLDVGRRALVLFGVSLAPNAVAVRIEGRTLVLHQLVEAPLPDDLEWPV